MQTQPHMGGLPVVTCSHTLAGKQTLKVPAAEAAPHVHI